jgi:hypothetical protein
MATDIYGASLKQANSHEIAAHIASIVQGIRFGSVEIVVHDGRIVQIDKRERFRVNNQQVTD